MFPGFLLHKFDIDVTLSKRFDLHLTKWVGLLKVAVETRGNPDQRFPRMLADACRVQGKVELSVERTVRRSDGVGVRWKSTGRKGLDFVCEWSYRTYYDSHQQKHRSDGYIRW